jgi:undecaprenyl-diphosphatase
MEHIATDAASWQRSSVRTPTTDSVLFSLKLGLLVALVAMFGFALLARSTVGETSLTAFDQRFAQQLHTHARSSPSWVVVFQFITELGSIQVLVTLVVAVAVILRLHANRRAAWGWVLAASGGLLHRELKTWVPRLRPEFDDPLLQELSLSFPSGHAMASLISYGLLAYILVRVAASARIRVLILSAAGLLIAAISFSRLYLGVHYFSDVLGGFAAGAAWLSLSICCGEWLRRSASTSNARPVLAEIAQPQVKELGL